jgi:hypothetical protein
VLRGALRPVRLPPVRVRARGLFRPRSSGHAPGCRGRAGRTCGPKLLEEDFFDTEDGGDLCFRQTPITTTLGRLRSASSIASRTEPMQAAVMWVAERERQVGNG